jgi:hypothetical protein
MVIIKVRKGWEAKRSSREILLAFKRGETEISALSYDPDRDIAYYYAQVPLKTPLHREILERLRSVMLTLETSNA